MKTVDVSKLIGIPYEKLDCFQLVKKFYKQATESEVLEPISAGDGNWENSVLIQSNKGKFKEVRTPNYGDIVVMKVHGLECHLGVYLERSTFIHTTKKTGSVIDQVGRWSKLITGYYRLEEKTSGHKD